MKIARIALALSLSGFFACAEENDGASSADCGDGVRSGNEQCDDGNNTGGDGCDSTCRSETNPLCGNGQIDGSEQCDDRNYQDNDGCTSCVPDAGFTCTGEPSVCVDGSGGPRDAAPVDSSFMGTLDQVVINEVLVNAAGADSNCDGTVDAVDDEFVELVNDSSTPRNLMNMTIQDDTQVRHTFAPGSTGSMMLQPGESVVVWGGGTPMCPGVTNWFVASTGTLGLDNTGETVRLLSGLTTINVATLPSSTAGVSQNRSPDITGTTFANHNTISAAGTRAFSPGRTVTGGAFPP